MKVRLFLATLCIFLLPMWFSPSSSDTPSQFTVSASGWIGGSGLPCECDGSVPECICPDSRPTSQPPGKDSALGSESLLILAALLLWLRFRG